MERRVKAGLAALGLIIIVLTSGLYGVWLNAAPANVNRFYSGGLSLASGGEGFSIGADTVLSRSAANTWSLGAGDSLIGATWLNSTSSSTSSLYVNGNQIYPQLSYSFTVWNSSNTIYARNEKTGTVSTGTVAHTVINTALNGLTSGRTWIESVLIKGDVRLTNAISLPSYSRLIIDGRLRFKDGIAASEQCIVASSVSHVEVLYGEIDGNSAGQTNQQSTITFSNVTYGRVSGVNVHNATGFGIYIYESDTIEVDSNNVYDCEEAGIVVEAHSATHYNYKIENNNVERCGLTGASSKNGIHIEGDGAADYPRRGTIQNNYITGCLGAGIVLSGGVYDFDITSNKIYSNYQEGIVLQQAKNCTISLNKVENNDFGHVLGYGHGIVLDAASTRNWVALNTVKDQEGYGIIEINRAAAGSDYNTICQNEISGNGAACAIIGANTQVFRNLGFYYSGDVRINGASFEMYNATSSSWVVIGP